MKLDKHDLYWAVTKLPKNLKELMTTPNWKNLIYVGGGYLRASISGEKINDIDVFTNSKHNAELIAYKLADKKEDVIVTGNTYTVRGRVPIQIIHRWVFDKPEDVSNSFDFTICCGVIFYNDKWDSFCDDRFYTDLSSKRLIYRSPVRNEDAGGSLLRVLKYYSKGYRIPINDLSKVLSRIVAALPTSYSDLTSEIESLLKEVDPQIDPDHIYHLPTIEENGAII